MTCPCPLPSADRGDLRQGVRSLVPKCRAVGCGYADSNLDSDWRPSGCVLIVVALVDTAREVGDD